MAKVEAFTYRCAWQAPKDQEYVGSAVCMFVFRTNSVRKVHADQLQAARWRVTMHRGQIASALCPSHAGYGGPLLMEDPARWGRK